MTPLAQALLAELTDEDLRVLAERLRPLLERQDDELLTPAVAAARLHIHPKTLIRAAADGRVPGAERVGRAWRFRSDQLTLLSPAGITPAPAPRARRRDGRRSAADAIRGS